MKYKIEIQEGIEMFVTIQEIENYEIEIMDTELITVNGLIKVQLPLEAYDNIIDLVRNEMFDQTLTQEEIEKLYLSYPRIIIQDQIELPF